MILVDSSVKHSGVDSVVRILKWILWWMVYFPFSVTFFCSLSISGKGSGEDSFVKDYGMDSVVYFPFSVRFFCVLSITGDNFGKYTSGSILEWTLW